MGHARKYLLIWLFSEIKVPALLTVLRASIPTRDLYTVYFFNDIFIIMLASLEQNICCLPLPHEFSPSRTICTPPDRGCKFQRFPDLHFEWQNNQSATTLEFSAGSSVQLK